MSADTIRVLVTWSVEPDDGTPPSRVQEIPRGVYDAGYTDADAVAEYLTNETDWLVSDWEIIETGRGTK